MKSLRRRGEKQFGDDRILGSSEFVREILEQADDTVKAHLLVAGLRQTAAEEVQKRCNEAGVIVQALQAGSKRRECTELRKELARKFVLQYGLTYAEAARLLGISTSAVNQICRRQIGLNSN